MTQKERAEKLCDDIIQAWLRYHRRELAEAIALQYLEEGVKEWRERNDLRSG